MILDDKYAQWVLIRIKEKSERKSSGCIEWIGAKTQQGYGQIQLTLSRNKYRTMTAHRAHWMAYYKVVLPKHIYVCHTCDNPVCINLDHLFLGSAKVNNADKIAKKRYAKSVISHTRMRKFDNNMIEKLKMETGRNKDIAKKYGVSESYVSQLRGGKAKKLINPPGSVKYYRNAPVK